jgi:20S proteasome subunit beta 6
MFAVHPSMSGARHDPMASMDYVQTNRPPHLPGSQGGVDARNAQLAAQAGGPTQHQFQPYEINGGTVIGVSGKDFAILACDTRLSRGYSILSRNVPKYTRLTDKCVIVTAGMAADKDTLHNMLKARMVMYEHQHKKQMSTTAIAQMLSNTLYYRRFFPYYTFNLLGGLDDDGQGCIFSYDAIGSYERVFYSANGSGQSLTMPLLDNQVGLHNQTNKVAPKQVPGIVPIREDLEMAEALELVKDSFTTAGERDIYTGDTVDLCILTADGTEMRKFDLKKD